MALDSVLSWLDANRQSNLDRLLTFLRFPTISAQSAHRQDLAACADWLAGQFTSAGLSAEVLPTAGHPVVYAEGGPAKTPLTILVYGHYDVQPTGEPKLWHSPPFEPAVRDGAVHARGAADDKGQVWTHVLAAEAWMRAAGALPIRVKFLIEGEEEIGSPNLADFVRGEQRRLACDYVVLSDTSKLDADTPALTASTRGLVYKQINVTGPSKDLHSGIFGGAVANPLNELVRILASLRDADNRVTIPGFYDKVRELTPAEREALRRLEWNDADFLKTVGSPALAGEPGFSTAERRGARPTLDINGICGGYTGEGAATVIPSTAFAKVSMRLVSHQDPDEVSKAFDEAVRAACSKAVRVQIETFGTCPPYVAPLDSPGVQAALRALERGYGRPAGVLREGGSLPILPLFRDALGAESLMLGFCMPDCNVHSANEFFHVRDLEAGARSAAALLAELAACREPSRAGNVQ